MNDGGITYEKTCFGRPGRRAGQPVWRTQADGPGGRLWAEHH